MKPAKEWWVGILFFAGLIALVAVTVYLSDLTLRAGTILEVSFDSIRGLRVGDDVNLAGMRVGSVRELQYDPGRNRVLVRLWVTEPLILHEGYAVEINAATLLGGIAVDIDPGPPDAPVVPLDRELAGAPPIEIIRSLGQVVASAEENFAEILRNLREITDRLARGEGSLGALLTEGDLVASLTKTSKNIEELSNQLREGKGTLGRLLQDDSTYDSITKLLDDLGTIGEDLRSGDGSLGVLLLGEEGLEDLRAAVAEIRSFSEDLNQGEGTLSRLARDDHLYAEVEETVGSLREFAASLRNGEGTLGFLANDAEAAESMKQIIADVREITRSVREGEGSLGKLLTSDELHDELLHAVAILSGAIEDARESAPLNTFTAALFTAF
jgi:phospholipid/cholesterol/gamma-HCH transport system substrate-binding protein